MSQPREEPYIWVTWLSRLLAGDAHCEWALWFKAHHTYDKPKKDETFDLPAWKAGHGEFVRVRAAELRAAGYKVFVEDQNKFALRGKAATVGGKPDIVAVRGDETLVVDCKTGAAHAGDALQVLMYMLILPLAHAACEGRRMTGEVRYTDHVTAIPADALTPQLRDLIRGTITRAGGAAPTQRVPSYAECSFCDITGADCPERVNVAPADQEPNHDLF